MSVFVLSNVESNKTMHMKVEACNANHNRDTLMEVELSLLILLFCLCATSNYCVCVISVMSGTGNVSYISMYSTKWIHRVSKYYRD